MERTAANPAGASPWRRKTYFERRRDVLRARHAPFNPAAPSIIAVVVTGVLLLVLPGFWRDSVRGALPGVVLLYLLVFFVTYFFQMIRGEPMGGRRRLTICTQCHDVQPAEGGTNCPCGGWLDDAENWTRDGGPGLFCPQCAYDMRGGQERCPECGAVVKLPAKTPPPARICKP